MPMTGVPMTGESITGAPMTGAPMTGEARAKAGRGTIEPAAEWPMCHHVERRARRLNDMIDRIGANRSRLVRACGGATIAEAAQNCLTCPYPTACMEWVADTRFEAVEPPSFCRNRSIIRRCREAEGVAVAVAIDDLRS